ncbi:head-tail adaptor protein [Pseudogracilibacillus sp. SE30717A]|uniref:head-tail adaptor protein n=1 Tax=Pseudogracilibacillus sp. SE30717A TaxID=3098293 RepID=UPI00300E6330
MKNYRKTYNDGYLTYGTKTTKRKNGKRIGSTFEPEGKLAFNELSIREQDYQMADMSTSKLDLKVETMYPPSFKMKRKTKYTVVIESIEYDVIKLDTDYSKNNLYFYLQEVGEAGDSVE